MEKMQELVALKCQGERLPKQLADTATTLHGINQTLRNLGAWVPQVDDSIQGLRRSLEAVDSRLNNLEAE
jgi:hypothetical protein